MRCGLGGIVLLGVDLTFFLPRTDFKLILSSDTRMPGTPTTAATEELSHVHLLEPVHTT